MKSIQIIALALLLNTYAKAQDKESYKFSEDITAALEKDTLTWKYQLAATNYSLNGYHELTWKTWLKNGLRKQIHKKEDSSFYQSAVKKDAKSYILERSKTEEIIIINEAHHLPLHRVFTTSLLKELYKNGYRYLGLEALNDSLINQRKFATQNSGFYTKEPQFGNLLHEALKLGFKVFGYEASQGKNGKEREIAQAENIKNFIATNPKGKALIHCGFSHVFENDYKPWEKAMAGRLKALLNIDPFTIDQELYTERGDDDYNPTLVNLNKEKKAIVLITNNDIFKGNRPITQTDLVIVHPKTNLINGRPNWLTPYKLPHFISNDKLMNNKKVLALAYRIGEFEQDGIAADIVEIIEGKNLALYLTKGQYQIILKDEKYRIFNSYQIEIK